LLFTITGKHIDITDALKAHAEEKTSKLPKFFNSITQIELIVDGSGSRGQKIDVELIVHAEHINTLVVTETGDDAYTCIDRAIHRMERQLRKKKEKQRNNKHVKKDE